MKEVFEAGSVAVIGASPNAEKPGHTLIASMLAHGYQGAVYPVNPKYGEILGLKCFPSISALPGTAELAFFATPAGAILGALDECRQKGVRAIVIISAGFSEASEEGAKLEATIAARCRDLGIRILGPNTTGFVSASRHLVASINQFDTWLGGDVAIAGQTGIFAGAYMDEVMSRKSQRVGYELSVSLGNKADFDETDFVGYAGRLEGVKVVQLHLESIKRPQEFFAAVDSLMSKGKPVVLLLGGRTPTGRESARHHTGSSSHEESFNPGILESRGVVVASDIEDFFDVAKGFSYQPLPRGNRVGVLTMSGANGTFAADAIEESGLKLAEYAGVTLEAIKRFLPHDQALRNPADIGFVMTTGKEVRRTSMQAVLDDPGVDALLMIDLPVSNSDYDGVRATYEQLEPRGKPVFVVLQGGKTKEKWLTELEGLKIPVFPTPGRAVRVAGAMWRFGRGRSNP